MASTHGNRFERQVAWSSSLRSDESELYQLPGHSGAVVAPPPWQVNDRVQVLRGSACGAIGTVRALIHIGCTPWIGIELDEQRGRNDGRTASGAYHFRCAAGHGIYIRNTQTNLGIAGAPAAQLPVSSIGQLFMELDRDGDGQVTKPEFLRAMKGERKETLSRLFAVSGMNWKQVFAKVDTDNSCSISLKEFKRACASASASA